jgi:hypothetical protein
VALLNDDAPGRVWFFGPDAMYRKTAVVAVEPDRITRCRSGLCIYSGLVALNQDPRPGVFFCDDEVTHCAWNPAPDVTNADGDLLRGTAVTSSFLSRTEFPPGRPSTQQVIYKAPD